MRTFNNRSIVWAAVIIGVGILSAFSAFTLYDSIPGTVRYTPHGIKGTGPYTFRYKTGQVKLIEDVRRGIIQRSRWYRTDGSLVAETHWKDGDGIGYYLREDGSVRSKMTYVNQLAQGTAWYYNPDGTLAGEAQFASGQRVSGFVPPQDF